MHNKQHQHHYLTTVPTACGVKLSRYDTTGRPRRPAVEWSGEAGETHRDPTGFQRRGKFAHRAYPGVEVHIRISAKQPTEFAAIVSTVRFIRQQWRSIGHLEGAGCRPRLNERLPSYCGISGRTFSHGVGPAACASRAGSIGAREAVSGGADDALSSVAATGNLPNCQSSKQALGS